jgi:SAM-dependent methyltransferase
MGSGALPPRPDDAEPGRVLDDEQARIRRVFAGYDGSPGRRRAWDPERPGNRRILCEFYDLLTDRLRAARTFPAGGHALLDIGCGSGPLLEGLLDRGAEPAALHGIDLLEGAVLEARARLPGVDVVIADARALPYPSASMDAVVMATVLSSVLDAANRVRIAAEALRVLRPGGCAAVYDFRVPSPWNPNVRAMSPRALGEAFPGCTMEFRRLTLVPPLARLLGPGTRALYPVLAAAPFLRTHLLTIIRPVGSPATAVAPTHAAQEGPGTGRA